MAFSEKFARLIWQHRHDWLWVAFVTRLVPSFFFRAFYAAHEEWGEQNGPVRLTLSFDTDAEEDIQVLPDLADLLQQHTIRASFACVGEFVERFPDTHRLLVASGHELVNHGYSIHTYRDGGGYLRPSGFFDQMAPEARRDEIVRCHEVLLRSLGYQALGFRTPHFGTFQQAGQRRELYTVLKRLGYEYSSSVSAIELPNGGAFFAAEEGLVEFPLTTCPWHPFTPFDSWHLLAGYDPSHRPEDFAHLARWMLRLALASRGFCYINLYFDPHHVVRAEGFRSFLEEISAQGSQLQVVTYREVIGDSSERRVSPLPIPEEGRIGR